jgi:hypothetical protein
MRSEDAVPLYHRYLSVEGHLSSRTRRLVRQGLPETLPVNSRVCFLAYGYADLPLPKEFDRVFRYDRDETAVRHADEIEILFRPKHLATVMPCRIRILAATQPDGEPLEEIPDGEKTIALLEFPDGVPHMIDELPVVHEWGESRTAVALCTEETLMAIERRRTAAV